MKLIDCFNQSPFYSAKYRSYFEVYENLLSPFKNKKIKLVEIGVNNGGSLFMWKKYLGNLCEIIGIDNNPRCKELEKFGFKIFIGDQSKKDFWDNFYKENGSIDILVDDGGHTNLQQTITLVNSANNINNNGLIIFEDLHASYLAEFGNPSTYSFKNLCFRYVDKLNNRSKKILKNSQHLDLPIHSIEFYESLVCFKIKYSKDNQLEAINNNGKILNVEDFRYADNGEIFIKNKLKKFQFLEKIPFFGKFLKKTAKKIILPIFYKIKIIRKNYDVKKFF
jgi:hypothetical protein